MLIALFLAAPIVAAAVSYRIAYRRGRISGARYACRYMPLFAADRKDHAA